MHREVEQQQTQEAADSAPLPLFRSEVLASQESFYGRVVRIRRFSIVWIAALLLSVSLCSWSISRIRVGGSTVRVHAEVVGSRLLPASSGRPAPVSVVIHDPGASSLHPGMTIGLRCIDCPQPATQWTATILGLSNGAAPALHRLPLQKQTEVELAISSPSADGLVLHPGIGLDLLLRVPEEALKDWLFERVER